MKWAIRALTIASTALWVILVIFSATAIYSALQLNFGFEEPRTFASNDVLTMSLPFSVGNGGFYDISDLKLTTDLNNNDGTLVSNSTTLIPLISHGSRVNSAHNISMSIDDLISKNLSSLLFQDSVFDMDMHVSLEYARTIPLQFFSNKTLPWGAPLANLSVERISAISNVNSVRIVTLISFENHSFFALNGTITLELVDDRDRNVGAETTSMSVPPMKGFNTQIEVVARSDAGTPTKARLYFQTSAFNFGPVVIPLG